MNLLPVGCYLARCHCHGCPHVVSGVGWCHGACPGDSRNSPTSPTGGPQAAQATSGTHTFSPLFHS